MKGKDTFFNNQNSIGVKAERFCLIRYMKYIKIRIPEISWLRDYSKSLTETSDINPTHCMDMSKYDYD
jgi:hypothetical protein